MDPEHQAKFAIHVAAREGRSKFVDVIMQLRRLTGEKKLLRSSPFLTFVVSFLSLLIRSQNLKRQIQSSRI